MTTPTFCKQSPVPEVILMMEGLPPPREIIRAGRMAGTSNSSGEFDPLEFGGACRTVPATHPHTVVAERWQPAQAPSICTRLRRPSKSTRGTRPPLLDARQARDTFTDLSRLFT